LSHPFYLTDKQASKTSRSIRKISISSFGKGYEVDSNFKPKDNSHIVGNPFFLIDGSSTPLDSKYRLLGISENQLPEQFRIVISYGISLQKFEKGKIDQFYAERFSYASAEPQQG
jgi:hypothetical protein